MSGLEVAGVVLGGIPLLISGLEHYAEGAQTIKIMFRARSVFKGLSRSLGVERQIFYNTIELLLKDCVDDDALQDLLENVGGPAWSEPAVEDALQRRLAKSYGVYFDTVEEMNKTVARFHERLPVGNDGKGPFSDPNSFRMAYKRFRFGISKADYSDLIDEMSKCNTRLQNLTKQSVALEGARAIRKRMPDFTKIRDHASSMFSTLQTGLRGSCKASHRASLYMRPLEYSPGLNREDQEHAFRVILHHEFQTLPQLPTQWIVEEAEVRMLDATVSNKPAAPQCLPQTMTKGKKAVRWQNPQSSVPPVAPSTTSNATQQQTLDEIKDLCESIQRLRASECGICLGYLQDQVNAHRHGLYWPEKPLVDRKALISVSLGSILSSSDPQASRLSVADSRRLALSLSLGVLRLHDTPWLARQWSRDDITLFKQNNFILAKHPFVSTDLQAASQKRPRRASPTIRNETLFALGIVLIELCLRKSFDDLQVAEDLNSDGTKHAASDFLAADRLLDEVYDQAGKRYGDAVRRCVRCEFDERSTSLEDDAFRRAVYETVIAVLEEDVKQFFGL